MQIIQFLNIRGSSKSLNDVIINLKF